MKKLLLLLSFLAILGCPSVRGEQPLPGGEFTIENRKVWMIGQWQGCMSDYETEYGFYMTFPDMDPEVAHYIAINHFHRCFGTEV
jgi:hypothetical protein